MKNTSFLRVNSSFATIVLVVIAVARADAEIMVADSIEWRVADADAIIRASVTAVDIENGVNGLIIEKATLKVDETLKGTSPQHLQHSARLYSARGWEKFDRPSRWKREGVELLIFLKKGKIKSLLRLDGKKSHGQGHRAFTLDMKVCKTRNSILAAVYSALAFEEHEKPDNSIEISVPPGVEFWSELWGGSDVLLTVPVDGRLQSAANRWKSVDTSSLKGALLKEQAPRILEGICPVGSANAAVAPVVYLPKAEDAKTGNRLRLPGPWGKTVKGLRCRITELALAEQRFTVEIQNQSDEPIRVITAPKSGWPDSIGLEWAFYDPGQPPKWVSTAWDQSEPVEPGHVVLQPGKSHYRTSGFCRTPGSRFKVRCAHSPGEFIETGAVELPTSVSVTGISGSTGKTGKQAVGEELSDKSFAGSSRPIREDEDILDYVTTQRISLRSVMPIIVVEGSPEEVLQRSEESFRKFIAELPKPRTVSKLLKLYGEEDDAARKLDLKRVLKLSGDSRAVATGPWNDILVFPYPGNRRGQAELERFSASLRKTRIERRDDLLRQMLEQAPADAVRNYLKDLREKDRAASRNASSLLARLAEIGRLNETTAPDFLQKASEGRDVDAICISLFVPRNDPLEALAADTLRDLADPRAVKSLAIRLQLAMCVVAGGAEPQMMREELRWSLVRALSSCTGIEIPKTLRTGELGDSREVCDGIFEFLQKCKVWLVANGRDQAASSNRRSDTRTTAFIVFQYPDVKKRPAELDRFMDSIATVTDDDAHRLLRRMVERVPVNDVAAYLEKKSTSASRKTTRGKAAFLLARLRELLSLDWQTMPAFLEEAEAKGEFDATCVLLLGARAQGLSALAAESLSKAAHPDAARCVAIGLQFAACRPTGGTEQQLEQLHLRYRLVEALSSATGIDTSSFDGTGAGACHILVAAKNWMEKRKAD